MNADPDPDILGVQLKRIGDAVLTAPALGQLRARHPRSRITLVLDRPASDLADAFAMVDEVLVCRHGPADAALWLRLAAERFDLCLDFTGTDRSAAMAFVSGAQVRVGYARFCRDRCRRRAYTRHCSASVRDLHTVDFHAALVADAAAAWDAPDRSSVDVVLTGPGPGVSGVECAGPERTAFRPTERARQAMRLRVAGFEQSPSPASMSMPPAYALVHPGTARPEKFWLPDRWARVIRHLVKALGLRIVLTGGAGDPFERSHLQAIRRELNGLPVIDLAGRISLVELAALTADARIAVGVDSAAMHLAAVEGTPQVVLFGPTNPYHWRPRHPRAAVVRPPFQGPLHEPDFAARSPGVSMRLLSTEAVIRAIDHVLERDPQGDMPASSGRTSTSERG